MQHKHTLVADGNTYVIIKSVDCLTSHNIGNQASVPKAEPQHIRKQEHTYVDEHRHQGTQRFHVISKVSR